MNTQKYLALILSTFVVLFTACSAPQENTSTPPQKSAAETAAERVAQETSESANELLGQLDEMKQKNEDLVLELRQQNAAFDELKLNIRQMQDSASGELDNLEKARQAEYAAAAAESNNQGSGLNVGKFVGLIIIIGIVIIVIIFLMFLLKPKSYDDDDDDFADFEDDDDFGFDEDDDEDEEDDEEEAEDEEDKK